MPLLHTLLFLLYNTVSVYIFTLPGIGGGQINLSNYAGKKILLVNTASQCQHTPQYAELQQLQQQYAGSLVVIAIPSNNFNNMEPGSNEEILQFIQQYHLSFPVAARQDVVGDDAHPLYQWHFFMEERVKVVMWWVMKPTRCTNGWRTNSIMA